MNHINDNPLSVSIIKSNSVPLFREGPRKETVSFLTIKRANVVPVIVLNVNMTRNITYGTSNGFFDDVSINIAHGGVLGFDWTNVV